MTFRILAAAAVAVVLFAPASGLAQGRYAPKGAASLHVEQGDRLLQAGDRLRADGKAEAAKEKWEAAAERFEEAREADAAYVDARVRLGVVYYRLGQSKKALDPLKEGLEKDADNLELLFWMGQNEMRAEAADAGVKRLEALTARTERFPEAWLSIANHYYGIQQFDRARPAYNSYLRLKPGATAVRAKLGNTCFKLKLFKEALTHFERVREDWPDNVLVQVNIGNAHYQMGTYDKAVKALTAALKKEPDRQSALFNLAQSLLRLKRHAEAIPYYERFLKQKPTSFNGHYFLGTALMEAGRDDAALAAFKKATELKSKIVEPRYKTALIHLRAKRSDAAEAALRGATALRQNDPWLITAQGTVKRQKGALPEARMLHARAAALKPDNAILRANLAITELHLKHPKAAFDAADRALTAAPDDAWVRSVARAAFGSQARALAAAGQPKAAVDLLKRALSLGPDPTLSANLAVAHVEAGELSAARAALKPATTAAPKVAIVLWAQARVHLADGKAQAAEDLLSGVGLDGLPAEQAIGIVATRGAALVALKQERAAIELLAASLRSWPDAPALAAPLAVAQARLVVSAASRGASVSKAALRGALAAEAKIVCDDSGCTGPLDVALAGKVRYAALVTALKAGEGSVAQQHLNRLVYWRRRLPKKARILSKGTSARHLDLLHAWTNLLQGRAGRAASILAPLRASRRRGTPEGQLMAAIRAEEAEGLFKKGNLRGAAKALKAALKLGQSAALAHNLAVIDWQQGMTARAASVWKKVAGAVPTARYNLALAAERAGDHRGAWQYFTQAGKSLRGEAGKTARARAEVKARIFGFKE